MSALREAAQQALEALEFLADEWGFTHKANRPERWRAIEALRAALAQQAEPVEPVAWQCREHGDFEWFDCGKESYGINPRRYTYRTLYTAPPQRKPRHVSYVCPQCHWSLDERKPLTDEEIRDLWSWAMTAEAERTANTQQHAFARAIERAHGIGGSDE